MGNPHVIIYLDKDMDIKNWILTKLDLCLKSMRAFPEGINTEFIQVVDGKNLNMRVWERGSGETFCLRNRSLCKRSSNHFK